MRQKVTLQGMTPIRNNPQRSDAKYFEKVEELQQKAKERNKKNKVAKLPQAETVEPKPQAKPTETKKNKPKNKPQNEKNNFSA